MKPNGYTVLVQDLNKSFKNSPTCVCNAVHIYNHLLIYTKYKQNQNYNKVQNQDADKLGASTIPIMSYSVDLLKKNLLQLKHKFFIYQYL